MSNNGEYPTKVVPNEYSARGWTDYQAGKPYPREYDEWDQVQQRHYERGRLRASGAPMVYAKVPKREPHDIVQRTNGLGLVPRSRIRGKRKSPLRPLRSTSHSLE
jgi:hypothetical protein